MDAPSLAEARYISGEYATRNPSWHAEDAEWKAKQVAGILVRAGLSPASICDVGCGTGGVLSELHEYFPSAHLCGCDIAPELAARFPDGIRFEVGSFPAERHEVAIALDVMEHVEDCRAFLRRMRTLAPTQVYHIPLERSVLGDLRGMPARSRAELGHLHHFSARTALALLTETGHAIEDWSYTAAAIDCPKTWRMRAAAVPRRMAFAVAPDVAARVLGGFSMVALCH